jgi:hypothetical protein
MPKRRRKTIFASDCDNILNHETKGHLKIYIFHVQYIMLYILIQVNEGIAKLVTLMVKGHLNKVMVFNAIPVLYCDNPLTMKHLNIFYILYSPPIHHQIHVFKIICSPFNMI